MKNPILLLIGALLFLWTLLGSFLISKNCNCANAAALPAVVAPSMEGSSALSIAISDPDKGFSANASDNLLFPLNSCNYTEPVSDKLTAVFKDAVAHLKNNPDRLLVLTGLYKGSEVNECAEAKDLGYGRAEKVKSMLVGLGAPEAQIRTQSNATDVAMHDGKVLAGVAYEFISGNVGDVEERLRMGNITLYFETNARDLSLTTEQQKYFEDLKFFISQKPDAKISVTGHTDNHGGEAYNKRLSRKRAEFVRDYMVKNGIPAKSMDAAGFGPDRPLDTNETDSGRAKNRRVEVKIQ